MFEILIKIANFREAELLHSLLFVECNGVLYVESSHMIYNLFTYRIKVQIWDLIRRGVY